MADSVVVIPSRLVPCGRPRVQRGDLVGMERPQPGAEDLGEERVIPVPASLVVERDDQQVRALQLLEPRLAVGHAGDDLAQRAAQAVEDRGAQEELLGLARQAGENLLDDVVEDVAVARPEPPHQVGVVGPAAQRDRGQPQRRSPTLGPIGEILDLRGGELDPGRPHECGRLRRREAEVLGAHLEELAAGTQARERERWIGARRDREPGSGRETLDEGRHQPMDGRLLDDVVVVQARAPRRCRPPRGARGCRPGRARDRRTRHRTPPRPPLRPPGVPWPPRGIARTGRCRCRARRAPTTRPGRARWPIQSASRVLLPKPAGAETSTRRASVALSSWTRSRSRSTVCLLRAWTPSFVVIRASRPGVSIVTVSLPVRVRGQDESPAVSGRRSRAHSAVRRDLDEPMSEVGRPPKSTTSPIDGWMRPRGVEPQAAS